MVSVIDKGRSPGNSFYYFEKLMGISISKFYLVRIIGESLVNNIITSNYWYFVSSCFIS
ncbi:hypothetical protein COO91_01370 [Nostoc flagelliforme CCNUN1]|uniref:Uncharacterized protein n=1 Tax=Nostoc flagelliforme CCNUN1 TaxID=2038116 RepID=A0A2K8SJG8_9NOSO|nr:hypothetical protein COO91_01370 [Nostoc flagelliforme CCNUN1]